jgi:hypothetical protein
VRGLGRTLTKTKQVVQPATPLARDAWRDRTRRAKRQMKCIMETARQRGVQADDRLRSASQRLLTITTAMVAQAEQVGAVLAAQAPPIGHKLAATLSQFVPLLPQVITQTTRRVVQGDVGPASENVVRRFEPHTAIIRQGKPGGPTACGCVLWLDEGEGGISSRYAVLHGNPADEAQLPQSVDHHLRVFKRPPLRLAGDRGVHTTANERSAATHGVKEVVLPKPGAKSAERMAHEQ